MLLSACCADSQLRCSVMTYIGDGQVFPFLGGVAGLLVGAGVALPRTRVSAARTVAAVRSCNPAVRPVVVLRCLLALLFGNALLCLRTGPRAADPCITPPSRPPQTKWLPMLTARMVHRSVCPA